jgi:hypothetical protein
MAFSRQLSSSRVLCLSKFPVLARRRVREWAKEVDNDVLFAPDCVCRPVYLLFGVLICSPAHK